MSPGLFAYLSSGLFLGWSLGANDAANIFGTAVGTRMVRFATAALIASVFVILGAVISGAGASHTLGKLGAINTLPGAFMAALAAALSVYLMTQRGLPVSTSQAIVGGIIGWNIFMGRPTDPAVVSKFAFAWVASPIMAGIMSALLFLFARAVLRRVKIHLLRQDHYTRMGLILVGAFGAYSLGANNIANVMGVFVEVSPFPDLQLGPVVLSSAQQLFLIGGIAIAVGIYTYSERVMLTVGQDIVRLTPVAALVVVLAQSLVLFLFASQSLASWLTQHGLPALPLVPVSSSQAVVGAVIGLGLITPGERVRWDVVRNIAVGWLLTPTVAAIISVVGMFVLQNVFNLPVRP
ncbi:inorganic phosphate transporter [Oceanithermus sp.]|uniref:inorganic phosphate transporter n=1 Tax=Oceanithermus sp. TaxID=2268145 RepID=UPI00257F6774|nr:inorganic phosphate transporter [Oceanithermus sp.]